MPAAASDSLLWRNDTIDPAYPREEDDPRTSEDNPLPELVAAEAERSSASAASSTLISTRRSSSPSATSTPNVSGRVTHFFEIPASCPAEKKFLRT